MMKLTNEELYVIKMAFVDHYLQILKDKLDPEYVKKQREIMDEIERKLKDEAI